MITIYETRYYGPTDNNGSRIRVTNKRTGKSRWHHWDHSVNAGPDQHEHAVRQHRGMADEIPVRYGGETKLGYLFVTDNGDES
jgi:hypothetical protein